MKKKRYKKKLITKFTKKEILFIQNDKIYNI